MLPSIRGHLLRSRPIFKVNTASAGDLVGRRVLKIFDSEGKPFYPEPEISNERIVKVVEGQEKKRFNPKAYADHVRQMTMRNVKACHFDNRITYIPINRQHPDFTRAKLIIRGLTPERRLFIALEGKNIIREALNCGMMLDKLFFTKESILQGIPELDSVLVASDLGKYKDRGPVILKVDQSMMNQLSEVETPPGLIGIFVKPSNDQESSVTRSCGIPVTVIGDNVRDPGNMGTLIRSSAAVGVEKIICTKGCANPWESKVVRSGAGAHFRVNLITGFEWSRLPSLLPPTDTTILFAQKASPGGNGQSSDLVSAKTIRNINYWDLDYFKYLDGKRKLCVVIGGETHGIDDEAIEISQLYSESYKINIPMMKGIDSLNSAIAASVILFEIQRQIIAGVR